jgi:hypothetical protein
MKLLQWQVQETEEKMIGPGELHDSSLMYHELCGMRHTETNTSAIERSH